MNNQTLEDLHLILHDDNEDLAYLDLCPVKATVDVEETEFVGIGNVCTKVYGLGYGGILIKEINAFFENNYKYGLLFCRENVVRFYANYGWKELQKYKTFIDG